MISGVRAGNETSSRHCNVRARRYMGSQLLAAECLLLETHTGSRGQPSSGSEHCGRERQGATLRRRGWVSETIRSNTEPSYGSESRLVPCQAREMEVALRRSHTRYPRPLRARATQPSAVRYCGGAPTQCLLEGYLKSGFLLLPVLNGAAIARARLVYLVPVALSSCLSSQGFICGSLRI